MMFSRKYLPLLGSLVISQVVAENDSCNALAPPGFQEPTYSFTQPFLPYLAPEGTQSFDDSDTNAIKYSGIWFAVLDPTAVNDTLHITNDTSASFSFTFTGTGIEWFGSTGPDFGEAQLTLSGHSAKRSAPLTVTVKASSSVRFVQQRIFSALSLPLDTYTLTVTNSPSNGIGFPLNVDALVVTLTDNLFPGAVTQADGWSLIQRGLSGVSAMQITIVSPTHALIFDKVEHNYATVNGHPAWSVLYDINTDELRPLALESNSFCASGSFLSNGTLVSVGGNPSAIVFTSENAYHDENGLQSIRFFEPCLTNDVGNCNVLDIVNGSKVERWYPTVLRITDGSVLIVGGGTANVFMNNHTINQPSVSFLPSLPTSPDQFHVDFLNRTLNANLFVHAFSLPNKRAFLISNTQSIFFNWGASPPQEEDTVYHLPNGVRVTYPMPATALLLPLSSADNYTSRILVCGGSNGPDNLCDFQYSSQFPASNQCSRIEIKRDGTTDGWTLDDSMPDGARVMPDGVLLPTGEVVIVNGASTGYSGFGSTFNPVGESNADHPTLNPIVYSADKPAGQRWTALRVQSGIPRMYHSVSTLTPNGDVMITGSNPNADRILRKYPTEYRVEWLSPPYMTAQRPTYSGLGPNIDYGTTFTLTVNIPPSDVNPTIKVSLMDLGFSTHSMHANTRLVYLDNSLRGNRLTVHAPPDAGVYPPGPGYLYVIVDGVASKAAYTLVGDGKPPVPH